MQVGLSPVECTIKCSVWVVGVWGGVGDGGLGESVPTVSACMWVCVYVIMSLLRRRGGRE